MARGCVHRVVIRSRSPNSISTNGIEQLIWRLHPPVSSGILLGVTLSRVTDDQMVRLLAHIVAHRRVDAWAYTINASPLARRVFLGQCAADGGAFFQFAVHWLQTATDVAHTPRVVRFIHDCVCSLSSDVTMALLPTTAL